MRTTIEVDDKLFKRALKKFPRGTTKRVIFNEALRALVAGKAPATPPIIGALSHLPVGVHADFDDPVPGFPGFEDDKT